MYFSEIAASLYAWDLIDEGIKRCLDNLQEHAGINSTYLVSLMHHEKRPLHQRHYPHNPVRKFYLPEDSRAYFEVHDAYYEDTPLRPWTSDREELQGTDWLDVLIDEARRRGLKTGAELSHTIYPAADLRENHQDLLQRNIDGEVISSSLMCMNKGEVRSYIVGLFSDVVENHDLDFVQTCLILFDTGRPWRGRGDSELHRLLGMVAGGGCFCQTCRRKAANEGLDMERVMQELQAIADLARGRDLKSAHLGELIDASSMSVADLLLEFPGLYEWMRFRTRSITDLFQSIHSAVKAIDPGIDFRYNTYLRYPELAGLDLAAVTPYIDSLRESDYSEQAGSLEALSWKRQLLYKERRVLGYDKSLIAALGVRPQATPEILRKSVAICGETGCDGLSLGHYDGATMARLQAIQEGMEEAEIELRD